MSVSELGVVCFRIRSFSRRLAFPRQRKQIKCRSSEFLICMGSIASRRAISVSSPNTRRCHLAGAQGSSSSGTGCRQDWTSQGMGHPFHRAERSHHINCVNPALILCFKRARAGQNILLKLDSIQTLCKKVALDFSAKET